MFNSISWDAFLTCLIIIISVYYSITTLLLYHTEIIHWVKSKLQKTSSPGIADTPEVEPSPSMMGTTRQDSITEQRTSDVSAKDISVIPQNEKSDPIQSANTSSDDNTLIDDASTLLKEIQSVVHLVTEHNSTRTECISLFKTLLSRYSHLHNTPFHEMINQFIISSSKQHFTFELSTLEINSWWHEETRIKK